MRVAPDDEPGGDGPRYRRPDRGALEADAAGEGRLADAGALGEHRDDADNRRRHLSVAHPPAKRGHHAVIGDVQVEPEHRLALRTERRFDPRCWRWV